MPYDSSIEFPLDRLNLGKQIGAGAFGTVREAIAFGESVKDLIDDEVKEFYFEGIKDTEEQTQVAVKTLNPFSNKDVLKSLMSELKIMTHLGCHPNIVNLLGAVTVNIQRSKYIIWYIIDNNQFN